MRALLHQGTGILQLAALVALVGTACADPFSPPTADPITGGGGGPVGGSTGGVRTGGATSGSGGSVAGATPGGAGGGAAAGGAAGGTTGGASGSSDANVPGDTAAGDVELPVCSYPEWSRTTAYKAGDIVLYQGKAYVATGASTSLDPTVSTFFWQPYAGCKPPPPPPSATCDYLDTLLPKGEATFKEMFVAPFQGAVPMAAYSYTSLCKAMATPGLSAFARSGNATQDKRELAAFFANVAVETAYLTAIDERGHKASDGTFHGRGSLQITGQAIYQECGGFLGLNLAGMPQLGSTESVVWQTGIWYWTLHANPSVSGPQICHAAIAGGRFGATVRIIKGDCSSAATRTTQYRKNCMLLGVEPGDTACP